MVNTFSYVEFEGLVANRGDYENLYNQLQLSKPKDIKTLLAIIGKGPQNLKVVFGNLGVLSKLDAKSQLLN